ncbi:hypothetical protein Pst134EA_022675 [Puccinia striiformis f. sp. tritici]|uniref:Secreted protein n=1 Tax=Puccinia striiformis f. sp. tritici PST-78 TaxID=1165861 RepID=A0A0L0VQA0_9BASI|nr:hypothetical protein Pst134EA_022675 [Puccinia striiformis f. sp. tritici]KAI9605839.1 hypothetical protein H4Q26_004208 [Puccinia striiformis f. sp. tritici PST-130]KNF01449.1 hypothetical protein PSTG_05233 [Puccinia striiformis f. sp. tritici PST-78]KAH9445717.1 hypothetical protein Pst134EB_023552 [Puccinia striiformis f. sp. tritici]KAH9455201.1 hypothetical protein Pst134EA_022675 [Puccinia striiformis f. sp. tritici]KAI9610783.1 hypothetical protein KEM48_004759 [Puccinia striiformis
MHPLQLFGLLLSLTGVVLSIWRPRDNSDETVYRCPGFDKSVPSNYATAYCGAKYGVRGNNVIESYTFLPAHSVFGGYNCRTLKVTADSNWCCSGTVPYSDKLLSVAKADVVNKMCKKVPSLPGTG